MKPQLHKVTAITDPLLVPAFRIYAEAFPPNEQMSTAFWLETLMNFPDETKCLNVVIGQNEASAPEVWGMTYHEIDFTNAAEPVVAFWYLCTRSDLRGKSIGSQVYQAVVEQAFAMGAAAFVFEVEIPEIAGKDAPEKASLAARRIAFYRRQGAKMLNAVTYYQGTDNGSEAVPMHIMLHTPNTVSPEEALRFANSAFSNVQQSGTMTLD